ncbi:hypothetical protein QUA24_24375 [Microcoleus sp. Pol12B5]
MEYNEYKPLRDERKLILDKIRKGNTSQQLIDRLDVVRERLKKDPPSLAALYGCVGE